MPGEGESVDGEVVTDFHRLFQIDNSANEIEAMQQRSAELEEKLLQTEGLVKRLQQETSFLERQHKDVLSEVSACSLWLWAEGPCHSPRKTCVIVCSPGGTKAAADRKSSEGPFSFSEPLQQPATRSEQ